MSAIQIASLFAVLEADDRLSAELDSADKKIVGLGKRIDKIGDQMMATGGKLTTLTEPLRRFGLDGINVASDFEAAMKEISARTGVVGEDLESIRQLALQMGSDTVFSAQDAADAFLQLLSSGQSAEEAIATLPAVLTAAAASGEDLGATADTITDIMAAFGLGVEDAAAVVDSLARAAGASSADMASLGQGFGNVGNVAKQFGLSVDETAGILAIFAENGIKGAEAGTTLKSMLLNMTRPTDEVRGAWDRLGVSFYDANGNARDINDVLKDLKTALDPLPAQEQNEIMQKLAGSYGIVGLSALLGSISLEDMEGRMRDSADAAKLADAKMDTFNGTVDSLKGSVETLQTNALTPLMENTLKPLVERVTDVVNALNDWVIKNPEAAGTIVLIMGAVAAAGPVLLGLGGIVSMVAMAVGGLSTAIAFLFSPIGLAIIAVAALAAAYSTNFGGIRDFIDNEVRPRLEEFFNFLGGIWEQVRPALEDLYDWFINSGLPMIKNFITDKVLPPIQDFFNFLGGVWEQVRPALEDFGEWFLTTGMPGIVQILKDALAAAQQLAFIGLMGLNLAAGAAKVIFDALVTAITNFDTTIQTVLKVVGQFLDQLLGMSNSLLVVGIAIGMVTAAYGLMQLKIAAVSGVTWALAAAKAALATAATLASTGVAGLAAAMWAALAPIVAIAGAIAAAKIALDAFNNGVAEGKKLAEGTVATMSAEGQLSEQQLWDQVWTSTKAEHGDNFISNGIARAIFEDLKGDMVAPVSGGTGQGGFGAPATRDSGGDGVAGQTYLIGT
ncbi:MAG: phage tail tape measure protein, partial [Desulfurellales bacterium]